MEDLNNSAYWIAYSIYGPNDESLRGLLWNELNSICSRWSDPWCIRGDSNVVRYPHERSGGVHLIRDMRDFSDWINLLSLIDHLLGGSKFTWSSHQNPPSFSHLHRFLMSDD